MPREKDEEPRTWTVREAAEVWGVTPGRVRHWIYEDWVEAYQRAGIWFVRRDQDRPEDLRQTRRGK